MDCTWRIASTVIHGGERYVMVLKDETRHPAAKNLRIATSDVLQKLLTSRVQGQQTAAPPALPEPPADPNTAYLMAYFVKYTRIPVSTPKGSKHGSMIPITQTALERLLRRYGSD